MTTDKLARSICSPSVAVEGCALSMYNRTQRVIVPIKRKPGCTFGKINEKAFPVILVFVSFTLPSIRPYPSFLPVSSVTWAQLVALLTCIRGLPG